MELRIALSKFHLKTLLLCFLVMTTFGCASGEAQVIVITATFPSDSGNIAGVTLDAPPVAAAPTLAALFAANNPTADSPRQEAAESEEQYIVQPGDTLYGIASAYGTSLDSILAVNAFADPNALEVGQIIQLPEIPVNQTSDFKIIPDSRLVRAPGSQNFDIAGFIAQQPGFIRGATDEVGTNQANGEERKETLSAAQIVERVSLEFSVDARLLLALLEYRARWLSNSTLPTDKITHPMISEEDSGQIDRAGLYKQLAWTANMLNFGYYGWKTRGWTILEFEEGERVLYAPGLNAGTVGLHYFLSRNTAYTNWVTQIPVEGFYQTYYAYFGDPFLDAVEPLVPPEIEQPEIAFPFSAGETWFFTGGAHGGWGSGSAWAAIDFAPPDIPQAGVACYTSEFWVTAVAAGFVTRSAGGAVVLDLDGDGDESTGWTILYLHISSDGRVLPATYVQPGDRIGKASCEGGFSTATHMHLARRYNGEWMPAYCDACPANAPRPQMILSGWAVVGYSNQEYQGYMENNGERRIAEQGRNTVENRVSW